MRSVSMRRIVALGLFTLGLAGVSMGQGKVNLSLEPASLSVAPGGSFEVRLWARSDSPQAFDGADVVLQWDPGVATLVGRSDDGGTYAWGVSAFMPGSPRNDTWNDGDAIYTCLAPPSQPAPQTDLVITTFQFTASQSDGTTVIRIPTGSETEIGAGGVSVLGVVSGATITVGAGGGGGANEGGGGGTGGSGGDHAPTASVSATPVTGPAPLAVAFDGRGSSDSSVGETLDYRWDFGDGESAVGATATHTYVSAGSYTAVLTVTDQDGATDTAEIQVEATSQAGGGDTANPADGTGADGTSGSGSQGDGTGADSSDGAAVSPTPVPLCGAGAAEGLLFCAAGLFVTGRHRRGSREEAAN